MKWPTMIVGLSSSEINEHFQNLMIVAPLALDFNTRKIVPYKLGSERFGICHPVCVQNLIWIPSSLAI